MDTPAKDRKEVCRAERGVMRGLQPGLDNVGLFEYPLSDFFGFIPQQPPQQFPAWILWDNVDKRDPSSQVLIRRLRVRDILNERVSSEQPSDS